jgi:hypothetical protein
MKTARLPGFTAEASLGREAGWRRSKSAFIRPVAQPRAVIPQLGPLAMSGVDLGAYLRCRANGGNDLVCRFFGGLPPFTIGGLYL